MGVAGDVRGDPDQHLLRRRAPRSDPLQPLELVERVEHDVADAGAQRLAQLGLGLARCRGSRSARHRSRRSAPAPARRRRRRRTPAPPRRAPGTRPCRETPSKRTARRSRRAARAARSTNARARARRSSSATTYAGVPNSRASSTASQPPISRWPRSLTRVPRVDVGELRSVAVMRRRSCHDAPGMIGRCGACAPSRDALPTEIGSARRPRLLAVAPGRRRPRSRRRRDPPRRRLVQGEPPRFRPRARCARRLRGARVRPARPRRQRRADGRPRARRRRLDGGAAARARSAIRAPLALRGSSMGGYLAIVAAADGRMRAAVVAICPASGEGLRRGLAPAARFDADVAGARRAAGRARSARRGRRARGAAAAAARRGRRTGAVEHSRELAAHLRIPAAA